MDINSLGHQLLQTIKTVQVLIEQAETSDNKEMMLALARENLDIAAGLAREIANAPRPLATVEEEQDWGNEVDEEDADSA
jgi:hypothetical protein